MSTIALQTVKRVILPVAALLALLALLARRTWVKALCGMLLLVPVAVALSRVYRGMHHPSDVAASFLNGAVCIVVLARSVLDRTVSWGRRTRAAVAAAAH